MYYLTNFHLNLKLVDIIRATKIQINILITYKLSVNIHFLIRYYEEKQKASPVNRQARLLKTAATYSPTVTQYHRRDEA